MSKLKPPLPVDSGWAWFVMIGSFLNITIMISFNRATALFVTEFLDLYGDSATVTTMALGAAPFMFSVCNVFLPAVLLPRFSPRTLAVTGGVMAASSVTTMAFAPSMKVMTALFGAMGFAHGMLFVPQATLIGYYFKKRLAFANAFAYMGMSLATIASPFVTRILLNSYGLRGTLALFGAFTFNIIPISLLFRPMSFYKENVEAAGSIDKRDTEDHCMQLLETEKVDNANYEYKKSWIKIKTIEKDCLSQLECADQIVETGNKDKSTGCPSADVAMCSGYKEESQKVGDALVNNENAQTREDEPERNEAIDYSVMSETSILSGGNTKDTFDSLHDSVHQENRLKCKDGMHRIKAIGTSIESNTSYVDYRTNGELHTPLTKKDKQQMWGCNQEETDLLYTSHNSVNKDSGEVARKTLESNNSFSLSVQKQKTSCWSNVVTYIRGSIYGKPIAVLLLVASGLAVHTQGSCTYLPALGEENGLSSDEVPILLTALGVSSLIGKLVIGYIADFKFCHRLYLVCAVNFLLGVGMQFTRYCTSLGLMIGLSVGVGVFSGVIDFLLPVLITDFLGKEYIGGVMAGFLLINGVSMSVDHVIVGAIKDATGVFYISYHYMGALILLGVLVYMLVPIFVRSQRRLLPAGRVTSSEC